MVSSWEFSGAGAIRRPTPVNARHIGARCPECGRVNRPESRRSMCVCGAGVPSKTEYRAWKARHQTKRNARAWAQAFKLARRALSMMADAAFSGRRDW